MLNFIKKLFGSNATEPTPAPYKVEAPEFHEEIKQQVEAEKPFPVKEAKPAKAKKPAASKAPAKIKAEAKKAPAKKSKKQ